jgi:molybdenum cofactor biosynthesis protein B
MAHTEGPKDFIPLNIAVLTVSDTRSLADDKSGTTLADRLVAAGHALAGREIVVDDVDAIRGIVRRWIADPGIDVIITTGGTGFTGRGDARRSSRCSKSGWMDSPSRSHAEPRQDGASTVQSRATAGVAGATFIFCLPDRPAPAAMQDGILGTQARLPDAPCNFVEIMPRLDEHLRRPKAKGRPAVGSAARPPVPFTIQFPGSPIRSWPKRRCGSVATSTKPLS